MFSKLFLSILGVAIAAPPSLGLTTCHADNCLRAVRATRIPGRLDQASVDCSAYWTTTVLDGLAVITETSSVFETITTDDFTTTLTVGTTVTETIPITQTSVTTTITAEAASTCMPTQPPAKRRRQGPAEEKLKNKREPEAATIPAYASPCDSPAEYTSACACIGVVPIHTFLIPGSSTTVTTVETGTITVTIDVTTVFSTSTVTTALSTVTIESTFTVPAVPTVPEVQLSSPTAVWGDIVNGSPESYDDDHKSLDLPFPIEIYGVSTSQVYLSVNGFLSLRGEPSEALRSSPLPVDPSGWYEWVVPDTTVCGYWDDLFIYQGTKQGIYYQVDGTDPGSRTISFEFYLSAYGEERKTEYYHFLIKFDEANPGVVTFKYFETYTGGKYATIGAQSFAQNKFYQWSYHKAGAVCDGAVLVLDTNANTMVAI